MMTIILKVITFVKQWQHMIIGCLIIGLMVLLGLQTYRLHHLRLAAERDKVTAYEMMVKAQKAHAAQLTRISRETAELQKIINHTKLKQERCQENDYYQTANAIIDYFNQ